MRNANMWLCFLGWRFYCVLERSTQKMRHLQDFCRRFCRRFLVILADFSEFFPAILAVSMYEVELHIKQNATFLSRDIKKLKKISLKRPKTRNVFVLNIGNPFSKRCDLLTHAICSSFSKYTCPRSKWRIKYTCPLTHLSVAEDQQEKTFMQYGLLSVLKWRIKYTCPKLYWRIKYTCLVTHLSEAEDQQEKKLISLTKGGIFQSESRTFSNFGRPQDLITNFRSSSIMLLLLNFVTVVSDDVKN